VYGICVDGKGDGFIDICSKSKSKKSPVGGDVGSLVGGSVVGFSVTSNSEKSNGPSSPSSTAAKFLLFDDLTDTTIIITKTIRAQVQPKTNFKPFFDKFPVGKKNVSNFSRISECKLSKSRRCGLSNTLSFFTALCFLRRFVVASISWISMVRLFCLLLSSPSSFFPSITASDDAMLTMSVVSSCVSVQLIHCPNFMINATTLFETS